ncbi:dTMP kinase, partial [Endobacter medicaginis]
GGSPAAEAMRAVLLDPDLPLAPEAELLLVFAARADHLAATVLPALDRGVIVLCDRFADSTLAYQGFGVQADARTRTLIDELTARLPRQPDLTFVLNVSPGTAAERLRHRGGTTDRYETRDAAFHARVRAGFLAIAAAHPARCVRIDADAPAEAVHDAILSVVSTRTGHKRG